MSKHTNPALIVGGLAAAYLLLNSNSGSSPAAGNPVTDALVPQPAASAVPTTYGINSGVRGGNGSFYTVSNYAQLLAANPNLGNPNYQMTATENGQYFNNYLDLQQGLPSWVGQKMLNGVKATSLMQAIQGHWTFYGCAEKRIFLPLQPPSGAQYIPPPPQPKSSGSGIFGTILRVATIVGGAALTVASAGTAAPLIAAGTSAALTAESAIHGIGAAGQLNDAELQLLFQSAAIIYDILPLYQNNDPVLVAGIKQRLDELLKQYV